MTTPTISTDPSPAPKRKPRAPYARYTTAQHARLSAEQRITYDALGGVHWLRGALDAIGKNAAKPLKNK